MSEEQTFTDTENKLIYNELHHIKEAIVDIKNVLSSFPDKYVTTKQFDLEIKLIKQDFKLPKQILYGAITLVLMTVFGAILTTVIVK